jgi:SAM-dependent methyltransferase
MREYDQLAEVYELLVPEALRTPEGAAAGFVPMLTPGARILDCACGTGTLAVGLALAGFRVDATDASPTMVARTRALARERGVPLSAEVCEWERLPAGPRYDYVLCVGNSLVHARDRVAPLRAMAGTMLPGATLFVASRNWERERALGSRTEVDGPVKRVWTIPDDWAQPHYHDIEVGAISERLTIWPFTHEQLKADLAAADLTVVHSTYSPDVERYSVTARV